MAGQNRMLRQLQLWDIDSSEHAWSVRQSARARRLGLVTLPQMIAALVDAVEHPPAVERIVEVPEIKSRSG